MQFAFGVNEFDGCKCPARKVGFNPGLGNPSSEVAARYDAIFLAEGHGIAGTIPEEIAKDAWLAALRSVAEKLGPDDAEVKIGKEVAEELGWL